MQITELATRCGVSTHALRHNERLGLLQPDRHANGYRDYSEAMRREVGSHIAWLQAQEHKNSASKPFPKPTRKRTPR